MRALIFALSALAVAPAAADECDDRAARIMAQVGGSVRTRIGPAIKLTHPAAEGFSVDCAGPDIRRVSGSKDGPGSLAPMAQLLAKTTALALSTTEQAARTAMLACVRSAAGKAGTMAEESTAGLTVECYVLRDFVTMDIKRQGR